jgi:hypothetical protein
MNNKVTGVELAYLVALHTRKSTHLDLAKLELLGLIKVMANEVVLRQKGIDLISNIDIKEVIESVAEAPEEWIEDFRTLFKGKKPGAMGDKKGCLMKMKRFLKENPTVTKEEIFTATESYIQSCASDRYKYMQRSDYFIFKQDVHKGETSNLAAWIDELDGGEIKDTSTNQFIREA